MLTNTTQSDPSKTGRWRKVHIEESSIHGDGVHASRDIKRGETLFVIKGSLVHFVIRDKQDSMQGPNWIGIQRDLWIDPVSPSVQLNHSCDPNAGIKGRVTLVALRDVKKGEEITFDYSTTEDDVLWEFRCNCGAKHCRRTVRSIQSLPDAVYDRYLPYVPRYFQKVYKRFHNNSHGQ